jgi:hypothetical protein
MIRRLIRHPAASGAGNAFVMSAIARPTSPTLAYGIGEISSATIDAASEIISASGA